MEPSLKLSVHICLSYMYNVLGQLVAMCDKHNGVASKAAGAAVVIFRDK